MTSHSFPIADSHAHLYFPSFDDDQHLVIERNNKERVDLQVQIGCDEVSSLAALELAKSHPHFYCTLGLHPADVRMHHRDPKSIFQFKGFEKYIPKAQSIPELLELFASWCEEYSHDVVGFGETGFDLYHENSEEIFQLQKEAFLGHIQLCQRYDKTLVIHSREATDQTLDFLAEHVKPKSIRGIWHCFTETPNVAHIAVQKYGFMLGIGGVATYPKAESVRETIRQVPLGNIITETDAPFLTPQSLRRKYQRNEPRFLREVVELIAELKEMPLQETAQTLFENTKRVYQITN